MNLCDLTQFYSPRSGGVKRYLHEKIAYLQEHSPDDEHVLIVPGARSERTIEGCLRIYTVASPLVSRSTQYRALLNLRAVDEIIERERPDLIESADPYQLGWAAARISRRRRVPAVAFYHSHFAEAYLRKPIEAALGRTAAAATMRMSQAYVRRLYNQFEVTLVPSAQLAETLRSWGVRDVRVVGLGVNTDTFSTGANDSAATRRAHNIPEGRTVLLYVGRLAPEKNTQALFEAFGMLTRRAAGAFHLIVVGDGQERDDLRHVQSDTGAITWLPYVSDSHELAQLYRAADLFVHPGTQETFGLAALETQACGTPVVGFRGSAMDRIILHDQTFWATEETPETLASAIEQAVTRDLQPLGTAAATAVAELYGWRQVFERLFGIYREVCAGYRRSAVG